MTTAASAATVTVVVGSAAAAVVTARAAIAAAAAASSAAAAAAATTTAAVTGAVTRGLASTTEVAGAAVAATVAVASAAVAARHRARPVTPAVPIPRARAASPEEAPAPQRGADRLGLTDPGAERGALPAGQPAALADRGQRSTAGPRRVLVTGGARSGKSALAERMLADREHVVYLATGAPASAEDPEWARRLAEHQARRPAGWTTVETTDAAGVLAAAGQDSAGEERPAVLFDCVATWLTAAMDAAGVWAGPGGQPAREQADAALARAMDELVAAWTSTKAEVVAVTNEVGSGVVPATAAGRRFRDELGRLNARLAAEADEVWLCTAGIPQRLR